MEKRVEKNSKESMYLLIILILFLTIPIVSAGFFDFLKGEKITGAPTSFTHTVNITIGNSAPTVTFVSAVSAQTPTEAGVTTFIFTFNATDTDGASDLNDASANGRINITLNSTTNQRYNTTCNSLQSVGNTEEYQCRIDLWYFDYPGSWTINASIKDSTSYAENSSTTFTVNPLTAMVMSPANLTWPATITLTSTNTTSNNDPLIINNTGNKDITPTNIKITAVNLRGETTTTQFLLAANFTVSYLNSSVTNAECQFLNITNGIKPVNNSATSIATANISAGNNSLGQIAGGELPGRENLYFCLAEVTAGLSQQSYSTTGGAAFIYPWTLAVS